MRIIDKVDVNYFRSISSLTLGGCRDVNVIAGPNDAGKSNVLKAINLFFNNQPESDNEFEFLRDLNHAREDEARAAKGRMTIWVKIHFNNFLKWKSLPPKFFVKRSWNRYDDRPTDTYSDGIPPTTMGRFLNKLNYHYIPAVRGREIYGDLLAALHDTLVQDESLGLRQSSTAFVDDLHRITGAMSEEILERLRIESKVNIPGDLQDFFRALDFSTKFNNFDVPLPMRGDGIQSRHIPFILNYIASKSSVHHIWGYEEPENSLEISKAYEMAEDFEEVFSRENQIFITTHSPAFYDIRGPKAARWLLEGIEINGSIIPSLQSINSTGAVDKSLGMVAVIAPRIREIHEEYVNLQDSLKDMTERLNIAESPIVFVEGPTDVIILEHARAVLGFNAENYRIECSNGANDITAFLKLSSRIKPDIRPLMGIYDADATGRAEFEKCKAVHKVDDTEIRILDKKKRIYVGILSLPEHLLEAQAHFKSINQELPVPIEFMFESEVIVRAVAANVLRLVSREAVVQNIELPIIVKIDEVANVPEDVKYFCKKVGSETKTAFAEWVVMQDNAAFEPFRKTLEEIDKAFAL